ncbi:ABC transporter [Trema orientale]|uniref:ABC transporter n=1 Tax=Trema orientale TaxID=63057 RepID=A0A2P5BVG6_TREOI|nr:ABC transporter [Trema orientale]
MVQEKSSNQGKKRVKHGSIVSIFMHADRVDMWLMSLGLIGAVLDGLTDRLRLLFSSRMINSIGNSSKLDPDSLRHSLNKNTLAMLYLACLSWIACFLEGYCWTRTGERQVARMRAQYLKALLQQDLDYFDLHAPSASDIITAISNDSLIIQEAISEKIPDFVSKVSAFIGGYMVAFLLVRKLAMVALPLALLLLVPGWLCGRSLMDFSGKMRKEYSKAGTVAEQAISSIRTVYAFVGEKSIVAEFCAALNRSTKFGLRQGLVKGLAIGSNANTFVIWSFMSYYGSRLVISHGAQGGTIFAAGLSIVQGGIALGAGLSNMKDITDACCAGKRIMEVIKRVPKTNLEDTEGKILTDISGEVEFKNVKFSYPSRPESIVFKNFSLTIPAGNTVALLGTSGSGKSTALSLLQRFYDPLEGEILLDGIAIDKLQLKWLRLQIALVTQEPSLFSTTVKENILFGKEDATMEDILEASKACDAHNFISQLPQGYDTQVGERGVQLSGGQKQRIAIARALVRKPRILLLDEATSALDDESEEAILDSMDKVGMGRTTIIITHHFSTIKNANTIAVVENGHVKEIGSHNELIQEENSLYKSLVCLQRMEKEKNQSFPSKNDLDDNKIGRSLSDLSKSKNINLAGPSPTSPDELTHLEETNLPTPSFWRLLHLNKPEWKQASVGCLSAVLVGAIQPMYAIVMGNTLSAYFSYDFVKIKEHVRTSAFLLLGFSVLTLVISVSQNYSSAYVGVHLTNRIREMMLSKILTFEVGWFDKDENSSSVICSRLAKDANMLRSLVGDRISFLVQTVSTVTIAWTLGFVIAWRLAVVLVIVQPLIIVCVYTKRVMLKSTARRAIKAQIESTKLAVEAVFNLRTITSFSSQDRILKMLEKAQEGPRKDSVRQSWLSGITLGFSLIIKTCNWCLNYWYGGMLVYKGHVTPKAVFQTILIFISTGYVIAEAASLTIVLSKGWDAIRSIFSILDRNTSIEPENKKGYQPENITGHIELCEVHFAYPTRPNVMIFRGLSIKIEAGKSTALVGRSGLGKSTIISLIQRFYDPLKGVVKIDGRDIRSYHLRSLRKYIALVSQETTLFSGTIKENITYGSSNSITESEIIEAARAAKVHDFIMRQTDGYNTLCGDKGLQLSSGQKQQIAIARAILRNPSVLLLDEATSMLDNSHSENMVLQTMLARVMEGRTSVVVAHRLGTVQNCDQIVVLDQGQVMEKGTHSTLMAKGLTGAYYSLISLQTTTESKTDSLHRA